MAVGEKKSWREAALALKFTGVSLLGFVTDLCVLHAGLELGLEPAWARVVSLFCAMQVTFVINGLHVFRCLERSRLLRQWAGYMAAGGFGNLCNYFVFLTMVSTHWPVISKPAVGVAVGSAVAWMLNYCTTRFLVFRVQDKIHALAERETEMVGRGRSMLSAVSGKASAPKAHEG